MGVPQVCHLDESKENSHTANHKETDTKSQEIPHSLILIL